MAEYEFECRVCKGIFALFMRIAERTQAKARRPGCGSDDVEPRMQHFVAKTARKS